MSGRQAAQKPLKPIPSSKRWIAVRARHAIYPAEDVVVVAASP